jgi:hypothetical protein
MSNRNYIQNFSTHLKQNDDELNIQDLYSSNVLSKFNLDTPIKEWQFENVFKSLTDISLVHQKMTALLKTRSISKEKSTSDFSVDVEKSNYKITADGVIEDYWLDVENVESRIIDFTVNNVILECLVDVENKKFQNRTFSKSLLDGIPLAVNQPILIKIFTGKNEIKFQFINGNGIINLDNFEIDYFKDVSFDLFSKKI